MDTSTQYRLSLVDDAIVANADDPANQAKLVAYRATIADSRPSRDVGELTSQPKRSGGSNASSHKPAPSATGPQNGLIGRLMAERDLSALDLPTSRYQAKLVAKYADQKLGKAEASELIDWLNDQPTLATPKEDALLTARRLVGPKPASERQLAMVNARRAGKGLRPLAALELLAVDVDEELAIVAAMPDTKRPAAASELESGMYKVGDTIYKVYKAVHGSGKMCAKELVVIEFEDAEADVAFEYRGLAERFVTATDRMSLEDAKKFGAIYGVCCVCATTLTDEKSIAEGIGPVCGKRV